MPAAKLTALVDLDGTLTDPYPGISASILYALESSNRPAADELALRAAIGPPLEGSFAAMLDGDPDPGEDRRSAIIASGSARSASTRTPSSTAFPRRCRRLRDAGVQMFLASSKPRVFCETNPRPFRPGRFFAAVHGSELDGRHSDKSELIGHILSTEAIDPERLCHDRGSALRYRRRAVEPDQGGGGRLGLWHDGRVRGLPAGRDRAAGRRSARRRCCGLLQRRRAETMTIRTVHVVISGLVQGVGYRAWVEREATDRRLSGWVRNRRGGDVEAVLSGEAADVAAMLAACSAGPAHGPRQRC